MEVKKGNQIQCKEYDCRADHCIQDNRQDGIKRTKDKRNVDRAEDRPVTIRRIVYGDKNMTDCMTAVMKLYGMK